MTIPADTEPIDRGVRQPRGEEGILLAFVAAVLLLLSLVPVGFEQVIRPHRDYIENVLQPARESARSIEARSSEEVALSRGYLLTGDDELLQQYRQVQQEQQQSVERLRAQVARLLDEGVRGELHPEQRSDVQRIERAGRSMDLMIQHLVEVGRSDTAEVPLALERMSIGDLVRELIEEHRGQAEQAGLSLVDQLPEELPAIRSDPIHVRTALGNLLSNAVKYTPEGRIDVRAGIRSEAGAAGLADWVFVEVRDTGPGIRPEDQETVFQEFARLHTDRAAGEGIGLASSRRVAHRLGGKLLLESTPGRGSAFILMLPAE